jgi:hypothetical protein
MRAVSVGVTWSIQRLVDNERQSVPSITEILLQVEKAAILLVYFRVYHTHVISSKASEHYFSPKAVVNRRILL